MANTHGKKTELKALDGGLSGVPKPSVGVPADLYDEWDSIAAAMVRRKILTTPALGLLETYLIARWTAREAQKAIAQHGLLTQTAHGNLKPNPASGSLAKALEAVARLGAELGITPAAQSKAGFQGKERKAAGPVGLDV